MLFQIVGGGVGAGYQQDDLMPKLGESLADLHHLYAVGGIRGDTGGRDNDNFHGEGFSRDSWDRNSTSPRHASKATVTAWKAESSAASAR